MNRSSHPNLSVPVDEVAAAVYELDVTKEIGRLTTEYIMKRHKGTKSSIGRLPTLEKGVLRARAIFNVSARIESLISE